jgi:hypothetical protein
VKANQRNAATDVRVRKAYAVDRSRHFSGQCNAQGASAQFVRTAGPECFARVQP